MILQPDRVETRTLFFEADGEVPNNPRLPVLLMRGAIPGGAEAPAIRALLEANRWGGTWQATVFDFHHYHPDAHEALVVASGWADLMLGGPSGRALRVEPGDTLVLPAGMGHCWIDAAPDFTICGAYPPGQERFATLRAGEARAQDLDRTIADVPRPDTDPVYGAGGPVVELWRPDG